MGEGGVAAGEAPGARSLEILVRAVRHHDETHAALDPGDPDQWVALPGQELKDNGLFPELLRSQQDAIESKVRLRVLRGQPGTGKTTVLQQAALGAPGQRTLYLTYNALLAERARDFFDQFAPDPSLVTVLTFGELLRRVLPAAPAVVAPLAERITVLARALDSAPRKFAPWDKHPEELFGELHAWIAGAALPTPFRGAPPCEGQLLREEAFVKLRARTLDERAARNAVQAVQALDPRLLPEIVGDPWWARRALDKVRAGAKPPKVFADLHAVFVDEVQDLTLVEIALLAALVSAASEGRETPLDVMVAGDESQTVRPTDFDWGAFADAVAPTLGPGSTFDLLGNVRSPRAIATLVERSWSLYQHLDKAQRPRGRADLEIEESVSGRVLRCRVPDVATLARVGRALLERPSTVLVFPGARVPPELQPDGLDVWSSDAVKGLDFSVVAVVDGARRIREIEALRARKNDQVQSLRARTRADQFRVALSRATDTVIFLDVGEDPSGDGALHRLCVDDQEGTARGLRREHRPRRTARAAGARRRLRAGAGAGVHPGGRGAAPRPPPARPRPAAPRPRPAGPGRLPLRRERHDHPQAGAPAAGPRRVDQRLAAGLARRRGADGGGPQGPSARGDEGRREGLAAGARPGEGRRGQRGERGVAADAAGAGADGVRGAARAARPGAAVVGRVARGRAAPDGAHREVKLLEAVGGVRALFVDDQPETARVERALRRRVAVALRGEPRPRGPRRAAPARPQGTARRRPAVTGAGPAPGGLARLGGVGRPRRRAALRQGASGPRPRPRAGDSHRLRRGRRAALGVLAEGPSLGSPGGGRGAQRARARGAGPGLRRRASLAQRGTPTTRLTAASRACDPARRRMAALTADTILLQRYHLIAPVADRGLGETWEGVDARIEGAGCWSSCSTRARTTCARRSWRACRRCGCSVTRGRSR
ncbi:MAG: DEAD/DEAH box helicase family protein [Deltaproteobacteria bacterium]|nr:DEAD/DEAH box helicase family protein [Deltaproteobacteria bacterium]